ncbi:MAG: helix-turn-helix transcriptional regulator [Candidatus Nealsonbacteria bacterium]|nr:MAG: helix-turn-helix transcriptional regulator [Candidatus Nealsonbacteria bacterium]
MIKSSKKQLSKKIISQMSRDDKEALFEIAHKIAELRRIQSITQKELSKRIGTTQSTIARIEAGKQNLTVSYIKKIASALKQNISLQFINKSK